MKAKRNFLLVVDLETKEVKKLFQGPSERRLEKNVLYKVNRAVFIKHTTLIRNYPPARYDVVVARAKNLRVLKNAFADFAGWNYVKLRNI